jgi:hypothetical protein
MARTHYSDFVYYTGTDNPVVGVPVTVFLEGTTTPASIYTSGNVLITPPIFTNSDGYFEFYVDSGVYDIYVSGSKCSTIAINSVGDDNGMTEVATSGGSVVVNLPPRGVAGYIKRGIDANTVSFAVTVGGQTINGGDPPSLAVDNEYVWFTLIDTDWRITG